MFLARRNLLQDTTRLALSVIGVALAVMLILLLNGFLDGMYRQIAAYLEHTPGSVVVAQADITNLLGATSLLPPGTAAAARSRGATVAPILSQFVVLDLHDKKQPVYLVGYDPASGGGPWRLAAGHAPQTNYQVVFDRILAQRHGIALGSRVEIMDRTFTVVGFSEETASWMTSFIFIRKTAAEALWRTPGGTSFLLVTPPARMTPQALRDRLTDLPGADALLKRDMIANDARLFARFFSAPLQLMIAIAFLVGTLVVGMVIYSATVERQREYGVLKAIGARNGVLYRTVVTQALVVASVGALVGLGAAFGIARLIMALRPQFLIVLEPSAIAWSLLAGLAMALLAALIPVRAIAGLAPAEIFRR
ncbi:MAG TPA: ABC transporter permease [Roseiflexaceae bacterium]|nr:ABC transporter permease [Roseiflexaceae bacterium]